MTEIGGLDPEAILALGEESPESFTSEEIATYLEPDLASFEDITDVPDLLERIDSSKQQLATQYGSIKGPMMGRFYTALGRAVSVGEVLPTQIRAAASYVFGNGGVAVLAATAVASSALATWFKLFGQQHGNVTHKAIKPAIKAVTPPITFPVSIPEPNTPGGRIIAGAEKGLQSVRVTVPGLTAVEARGISLALSKAYSDVLYVLVRSLNTVEAEIASVRGDISAIHPVVTTSQTTIREITNTTTTSLTGVNRHLDNLDKAIETLQGQLSRIEVQIQGISQQPPVTSTPPPTATSPGLTAADVAAIVAGMGLATSASVSAVASDLGGTEATVAGIQTELQTAGVPNLPTTIQDLEDCCTENHAVTDPISQGGATPSLLRQLASVLIHAAEIGIIASWIDAIAIILDSNVAITSTVRGAEWVAPYAVRAVSAGVLDLSWADTIAGVNA